MLRLKFILFIFFLHLIFFPVNAQQDTTTYHIVIEQQTVNKTGKPVKGMTINGSIPGPVLRFAEGDFAVIYVENKMDVETSIHWHGILLPNFYDGVPYLTTPPILPGKTLKYEFPIIQSGTYWYHSHTMLQEEKGVYGAFVIEPKEKVLDYDQEQVLVISDWTNQKAEKVLKTLKRNLEWYDIKKGTSVPLNRVIARNALKAQLSFWKQRMEGADIADIYYPAFLMNGMQTVHYAGYKPGEKIRLRIVNASASSQYWITFGSKKAVLVSADGLDVEPVFLDKLFISVAETYDIILTIPENKTVEIVAHVQDGSGTTTAYFGKGDTLYAPKVPRPDKIAMMKKMAEMDMRMGAPAIKFRRGKEEPLEMKEKWGMQMGHSDVMDIENKKVVDYEGHQGHKSKDQDDNMEQHDMENDNVVMEHSSENHEGMNMSGIDMFNEYNYNFLKATEVTAYNSNKPLRNIHLNLTGNMWRYIWSLNGVPLSEADMIRIKAGEVARITLNNLTMMHHPMHLHGHFLYHLSSGMARIFSYGNDRDPRLAKFPRKILLNEERHYYTWGILDVASHMTELNLVSSNLRNQFNLNVEYGWNEIYEGDFTYQHYLYDYFSLFAGVNVENDKKFNFSSGEVTGIAGFRFLTPYLFLLDFRLDNRLRPQIEVAREILIFPRTAFFGEFEYLADFGLVERESEANSEFYYEEELVWSAGIEYFISLHFSIMASYDNRFGPGGGLSFRF